MAVYLAPILHHHCPDVSPPLHQERLLLAIGGLSRSLPCLEILASKWPSHYRAILRVIQAQGLVRLRPEFHDIYHLSTLANNRTENPRRVETPHLFDSITSYNLDYARRLLEDRTDADTANEDGTGILHALTYLRDVDATSLARLAVSRGADLNASGPVLVGVWSSSIDSKRTASALTSAILRGQISFAKTMVDLHEEENVPINDFVRVLATAVLYWHHELAAWLCNLRRRRPSLCVTTLPMELPAADPAQLLAPQTLLIVAMDDSDMTSLENRAYHGPRYEEAYASTIMLLISEGANPTRGSFKECLLYRCLVDNDHVALRCFLRYLRESHEGDPCSEVVDPGHCRGQPWSANGHTGLQTCIYSKSPQCFYLLLEEYPFLD